MSYDDDLHAIPSLCDSCYARLKDQPPAGGIGWKVLVFKCAKCKYEFCPHLESAPESKMCPDCAKADEYGPLGVDDVN